MNKEQALEKEKIVKLVKERIDKGEPKQAILEDLSKQFKDKVTIVRQLELTPSKAMKDKYRTHNYVLAGLMLAALVLHGILLFRLDWNNLITDFATVLIVLMDVVFLVGLLMYRSEIYSWIAACAVVTLITILALMYYKALESLWFVSLAVVVVSCILGLLLGVKLSPPRVPKIIEVDIDGTEKVKKTVYVFAD